MKKIRSNMGFNLMEMIVITLLLSIVLLAGSMLFMAGQSSFFLTSVRADLQENSRQSLQRISFELQESGRDSAGNLKVSILDGTGVNGSDILRFSVPLCICGVSPIDTNGYVNRWGAPSQWGQAGCSTNYPLNGLGTVDICHYTMGNPNPQDMAVVSNNVKAHLAHSDYLGTCGSCDPTNYTNRTIEYLMDNSGQLLRRVLDVNNTVISSAIFAQKLTNFQVSLNGAQTTVTVSVQFSGTALANRAVTISNSMDVILRNRG